MQRGHKEGSHLSCNHLLKAKSCERKTSSSYDLQIDLHIIRFFHCRFSGKITQNFTPKKILMFDSREREGEKVSWHGHGEEVIHFMPYIVMESSELCLGPVIESVAGQGLWMAL